mmetsp:Transcript_95383/g.240346  ORF Transcript_95383/g.240346 Transcript_95383/m.240346 type:complete len:214 (-) Transcript_95383:395-1036(-)
MVLVRQLLHHRAGPLDLLGRALDLHAAALLELFDLHPGAAVLPHFHDLRPSGADDATHHGDGEVHGLRRAVALPGLVETPPAACATAAAAQAAQVATAAPAAATGTAGAARGLLGDLLDQALGFLHRLGGPTDFKLAHVVGLVLRIDARPALVADFVDRCARLADDSAHNGAGQAHVIRALAAVVVPVVAAAPAPAAAAAEAAAALAAFAAAT